MTRNADIAKILGRSEKDNAGNQSLVKPGRNLVINGAMQVAQRGTSSTSQTTGGYKTVDRFYHQIHNFGTWDITQDTDVPTGQGFTKSAKWVCTTADASPATNDHVVFYQLIEAQNLQRLKYGTSNANSLTASFWVKSNKTGIYTIELYKPDQTVQQISKTISITSADTWEYKTVTFPGNTLSGIDNNNGIGLYFIIWMGTGPDYNSGTFSNGSWANDVTANRVSSSNVNLGDSTSNYINFTGVQFEEGNTATPFEHKPYVQDMTECLRYFNRYRKTNSYGEFVTIRTYSATQGTGLHQFPTPMRAAPTLSIDKTVNGTYFAYNLNAISITGTDGNFTSCGFHATSASNSFVTGGGAVIQSNAVQDISFNLNAEL